MTGADELTEREIMLNRFKRLIGEVIRGELGRNCFTPWEVELLLDIQACGLGARRRLDILRQYQRAVERQLDTGPGPPIKLSEFLIRRAQRREAANGG